LSFIRCPTSLCSNPELRSDKSTPTKKLRNGNDTLSKAKLREEHLMQE